jgi:hypothetical protein
MIEDKINIDPKIVQWWESQVSACPTSEISSVEDMPSPKEILGFLKESQEKGDFISEKHETWYNAVKSQYDWGVEHGYIKNH